MNTYKQTQYDAISTFYTLMFPQTSSMGFISGWYAGSRRRVCPAAATNNRSTPKIMVSHIDVEISPLGVLVWPLNSSSQVQWHIFLSIHINCRSYVCVDFVHTSSRRFNYIQSLDILFISLPRSCTQKMCLSIFVVNYTIP